MSECPAYGPDFLDEQVVCPGPGGRREEGSSQWTMLAKRRSASRREGRGTSCGNTVQPVGTSILSLTESVNHVDFVNALPVKPCRGGTGAREPVERDVVKHLLAAKHLEQMPGWSDHVHSFSSIHAQRPAGESTREYPMV